ELLFHGSCEPACKHKASRGKVLRRPKHLHKVRSMVDSRSLLVHCKVAPELYSRRDNVALVPQVLKYQILCFKVDVLFFAYLFNFDGRHLLAVNVEYFQLALFSKVAPFNEIQHQRRVKISAFWLCDAKRLAVIAAAKKRLGIWYVPDDNSVFYQPAADHLHAQCQY